MYAFETNKEIIYKKEEIHCINIIKRYKKKINYEDFTTENIQKHNPNWTQTFDHPYRILINCGAKSGRRNALTSLIKQQNDDYHITD